MVRGGQDSLEKELFIKISGNEVLAKQLAEPPSVSEERKTLKQTLETMKNALKVLQRDPDIAYSSGGDDELDRELREAAMQKNMQQKEGFENVRPTMDRRGPVS